jgi:hypothetical protein
MIFFFKIKSLRQVILIEFLRTKRQICINLIFNLIHSIIQIVFHKKTPLIELMGHKKL